MNRSADIKLDFMRDEIKKTDESQCDQVKKKKKRSGNMNRKANDED